MSEPPDAAKETAPEPRDPERRAALQKLAIGAGCVLGAAALAGPTGVALSPLFAEGDAAASADGWLRVDSLARFAVGASPTRVVLRRDVRDAWLLRRGETLGAVLIERLGERDFRVLSAVCPHLGCSVVWRDDSANWECPCHKSTFARDGALVPGQGDRPNPSPRALDPLEWRIVGGDGAGVLEVRWVRFKSGIAERVPLAGA